MEDIEQTQQDANATGDTSAQNESAVEQVEAPAKAEASVEQQTEQANIPFHEHPRWKEVMSERDQERAARRALEEKYQQLETRLKGFSEGSLSKAQEDALVKRLKGIDPEFGERFERLDSGLKELDELRAWKQQVEADKVRTSAVQTINQLHTQNKVSPELQEIYNEQLEAAYARNPKEFLKDLGASYKNVHEKMSKIFENLKRTEREAYVSDKKSDSKIPATKKGSTVKPTGDFKFSEDPGEARQQLVKRVLEATRAEREV